MAGSHGGEVAGEATGRDRGRRMVRRVRGEMVKFVNHFNLTLSYWRGEGELTEAEGGGSASLIELRGRGGEWLRPARGDERLANTGEVYHGGDNGAHRRGRDGSGRAAA